MFVYSIIFFLLALIACVGAGYLMWTIVLRRFVSDANECSIPTSIELGAVGILAIGAFVTILNFVVPISQWLSVFIVIACLIAGLKYLVGSRKPDLFKLLVLTAVIVLFSFWGSKFMLAYDAGLYHLQAISWMKDEPIVFGLTNIHDRFGFNSLWLSTLAVFWLPFFEVEGLLLANYLPAILLTFALVNHLLDIQKTNPSSLSVSGVFSLLCLASLSTVPFLLFTSTTSTDLAPNAFSLLSVFIFLRGFENQSPATNEVTKDHLVLWTIAIFAVLAKLSTITPCLLALIFTFVHKDVLSNTTIRRTAFFIAGMVGIWLLRNFFLSGCLVYPVGLTCAESDLVRWSVGPDSAESTRLIVEMWAKAPGPGYLLNGANEHWFDEWLKNPGRGGEIVTIARGLSIGGLLAILILFLTNRNSYSKSKTSIRWATTGAVFVIFATLINLLFGFLSAPDPSFWWGPLITLLILPVTILTFLIFRGRILNVSHPIFAVILLAAFSTGNYALTNGPKPKFLTQPIGSFRTIIPEIETELVPGARVIIRMPKIDDRCWLATKPCTPNKPQNLSQLHKGQYTIFIRKAEDEVLD